MLRRTLLLALSLLPAFRLPAQVPPPFPPPQANPAIPGFPPSPALLPPNPPNARQLSPGITAPVTLQMLDTDVKDVLGLYEKWTGRQLIYSTQLAGPIRIAISGQVPQAEAIKIVEMTLLMNGFNIVPTEEPKIWKVTAANQSPKSVGVPFVDREELLPAGEQTVMYLFKLQHADPTDVAQTIQTGILVPNQAGGSSVTPLPKSQAILVTENTSIIRTLIRIVRAIDVEPAEVVSEFISLEHAQAEEVAGYLEKLFEKPQTQQATGMPGIPGQTRIARPNTGGPPQPGIPATEGNLSIQINGSATGDGPTEDSFVVGKVRITADKRTNRLHVVSRPVNMSLIRALIKEYDAEVPLAAPAVRPLRFRPVEEVIDAVVAAIKDPGEKDTGAGAGAGAGQTQRSQTQQPTTRNNSQNTLSNVSNNSTSGSSSSSSSTGGETLSTSERDTQPVTQQVGKSTIIADKRANTIVIVGPKDITAKAFAVIDKLDVPQAQVMIHCIIGELTLTKNENFGLEYILRNGGLLPSTASSTTTGTTGTTGTTSTTTSSSVGFNSNNQAVLGLNSLLGQNAITKALTLGSGGISGLVTVGNTFNVALNALENSDRFRVIQRPSIFTSNNKRAVITSGSQVPVPTSIQSSLGSTNGASTNSLVSNSSIQYKDIQLKLEVLPLINSDKDVSLEIVTNLSDQAGTTTVDNNAIPNISNRALKTYVTVPNGGTLILGGLIKDSLDYSKSGVNRLVNIPIIGPLFGKHSKAKVRNELIMIMRPIVTLAQPENAVLREKTLDSFNVPSDLEAAIMPENFRGRIKPDKSSSLRGSSPKLRDDSVNSVRRR